MGNPTNPPLEQFKEVIFRYEAEPTGARLTEYNTLKAQMETAGFTVIMQIGPPVAPHTGTK